MTKKADQIITKAWYQGAWWIYLLWPLSLLYGFVIYLRKTCYLLNFLKSERLDVPVVVVGNITVGGTGKSPLVGYLVSALRDKGYSPGVISRGYGAPLQKTEVREVFLDSAADEVGDEPLMLKRRLNCPIMVSPSRVLAAKALIKHGCDIIISDDGLQHYALGRDLEVCVFDAQRLWGNAQLLPTGPLREPLSRLKNVDVLIANGPSQLRNIALTPEQNLFIMNLQPGDVISLDGSDSEVLAEWSGRKVHAVAGIGNPERFYNTLAQAGILTVAHAFGDHHPFKPEDFRFDESLPIMMTEKDAVKCRSIPLEDAWFLPVTAEFDQDLAGHIVQKLQKRKQLKEN